MFNNITNIADIIVTAYDKISNNHRLNINKNVKEYKDKIKEKISHEFTVNQFTQEIVYFKDYYDDKDFLIAVILFVDENFRLNTPVKAGKQKGYTNSLLQDKYFLLPRNNDTIICLLEQKLLELNPSQHFTKRKEKLAINEKISNYMLVDKSRLPKGIQLNHLIYDDVDLVNQMHSDHIASFLFIPFTNKFFELFDAKTNEDESTFNIVRKMNSIQEDEYKERYFESLLKATRESKAEIIMFPEMILTRSIVDELPKRIEQMKINYACIIVAGTLWENNKNTCFMYNQFGELIVSQNKYHPFHYSKIDRDENLIIESNHVFNIIDIPTIGRFVLFICKDFFEDEYQDLASLVNADFIIIPSFSVKESVVRDADSIVQKNRSIIVYANACNLVLVPIKDSSEKKNEIGSISYPIPETHRSYSKTEVIYRKVQCSDCNKHCDAHLSVLNDSNIIENH